MAPYGVSFSNYESIRAEMWKYTSISVPIRVESAVCLSKRPIVHDCQSLYLLSTKQHLPSDFLEVCVS